MIALRKPSIFYPLLLLLFGISNYSVAQCPEVYDFYGAPSDAPYWYECSGGDFNFNLQSPDNWGDYTIDWGDGSPITSGTTWTSPSSITHLYTAAVDTFNVVITEISSGCVINGVVVMEEATSASIQIPVGGLTQACAPQNMEFINSSTNVSETTVFIWDFGDGSPQETYDYTNWNQTVNHTYEQNTVDCETEVSLTALNYCNSIQGGESEATFNPIRVWDIDDAAIDASAIVLCYPDTTVTLENVSERNCLFQGNIAQRYEYWNFGDYWGEGTDSIVDWTPWPPTFPYTLQYPGIGSYNVMLQDSNQCGIDTAYITIQIIEPPVANISVEADTICAGDLIQFYQSSTGYVDNYAWNFGDGSGWIPTGGGNLTYMYNTPGEYEVCCAISVDGSGACSDTICVDVVVLPGPDTQIIIDNFEACGNLEVNYTEISTDVVNYEWEFDVTPFTYSGQTPPTVFYDFIGSYGVTLTVESTNGCFNSVSDSVYVYPEPTAEFIADNACENSISEFIDMSAFDENDPILSWLWDFGDTNTSSFQHPTNEYDGTGAFDVTLTVNTANCSSSTTQTITVDPAPTAVLYMDTGFGCSPLTVNFTNESEDATDFLWDFGDGAQSTLEEVSHTFIHIGENDTTFTVFLTASTPFGCTHTDSLMVDVAPGAIASFIDNTVPPGCAPFDAFFENTSVGADTYLWDFGDGTTTTEKDPYHTFYNETGFLETFDVTMIAYSPNGCNDTVNTTITVYPTPNFDFTVWPDSGCAPLMVTMPFIQGVNEFEWDFGDGETSTLATPTHIYYNETMEPIVFDISMFGVSAFGCVDSAYSEVIVNPQPLAQFTIDVGFGCSPLEVTFENLSLQSDSYNWNYGDGFTSDELDLIHTHTFNNYTDSIVIYEVVLTAISDDGCEDDFVVPITVYPEIQAEFLTVPDGCTPYEVDFENTSLNGTDFQWDLGNGVVASEENPSALYLNEGSDPLSLEACFTVTSDLGCSDSYCQTLQVFPQPESVFQMSNTIGCDPAPVELTNTSTLADSYTWFYGNGYSSDTDEIVHEYLFASNSSDPVLYEIMLVAESEFGCIDTSTSQFTLNPEVSSLFVGNFTGCSPLEIDFTNLSQGATDGSYWDFGDGDTSTEEEPSHIYFNETPDDIVFEAMLVSNSIYGCTDTIYQDITVYHTPVSSFEIDTTLGCYPLEVVFHNTSTGAEGYTWVYGTGQTGTTDEEFHNYIYYNNFSDEPVEYDVTLIAYSDQGCSSSDDLTITVWPQLEADFIADDIACSPFPVNFQNLSSGALSYQWTFDDGVTSTVENPSYTFFNSGITDLVYEVELIAESFYGCQDTTTFDITVLATPIANFEATPELQMYPDATVTLDNNSQAGTVTYEWDMGNNDDLEGENPDPYTYPTWGEYIIELVVTNGLCADTAWQAIEILPPPPVAFFVMDTTGCAPFGIQFHAEATAAASYHWDFGDGGQAFVSDPYYTYYQEGTFDVTLTVTGYGVDQESSYTVTSSVTVNPFANAIFTVTPSEVSIPSQPIQTVNLSQNATTFLWDFGDGETSEEFNPQHFYQEAGIYDVTLYAYNEWGCPDSLLIPAAVNATESGSIAFPTAFTPNLNNASGGYYDSGSFNNDVFRPVYEGVTEYNLQIYNKWGELLFESEDVLIGWDGYYHSGVAKEDVYVWKAKVRFSDGTRLVEAGNVTLLIK